MPYIGAEPDKGNFSDLNGGKLIIDADADTSITADTDDQIDIEIAGADDFSFKANKFEVQTGSNIDMNGTELILDADGDTSITADTDDQIDIKISGADDFQMTANTFTVLSGSTLAIASGATIANSGTATGFSSADPASADGDSLGTASAEWSDLYLADGGVIYFGNDQEITLTHSADSGLLLKHTATADDKPVNLVLQTGETDMAANDVIGKISFQAPDEGTGTDAILVSAAIQAVAEGDHSSSSNATKLDFMTGASEAATTKMSLSSGGNLTITSTDAGSADGPVLDLYRNSASPAGGDDIGAIRFSGENDAGTKDTLGAIRVDLDEPADGSEDASMYFDIFQNGSAVTPLYFAASSATAQVVMGHHGTVAQPTIAWTGDLNTGFYHDSGDSGVIRVSMNGDSRQVWTNAGQVILSDTSNGNMTIGFTINQGSQDNHIIDLKSSDIAHPFTGVVEADTYLKISKGDSSAGNPVVEGFSETTGGLVLRANYATANTTNGTSGVGAVQMDAYQTDGGTSRAAPGANDNMLSVRNGGNAKFLVKGDGDIYYDGADQGSYDAYEDAHITRALDLSHGIGVIDSKFDKFIAYNHEKLADMKLVGREENGTPNHFINITGMQRLHNGAIWQQYEKHENLLNAVYELAVEAVGEDKADEILNNNDVKLLSKNELLN